MAQIQIPNLTPNANLRTQNPHVSQITVFFHKYINMNYDLSVSLSMYSIACLKCVWLSLSHQFQLQ